MVVFGPAAMCWFTLFSFYWYLLLPRGGGQSLINRTSDIPYYLSIYRKIGIIPWKSYPKDVHHCHFYFNCKLLARLCHNSFSIWLNGAVFTSSLFLSFWSLEKATPFGWESNQKAVFKSPLTPLYREAQWKEKMKRRENEDFNLKSRDSRSRNCL